MRVSQRRETACLNLVAGHSKHAVGLLSMFGEPTDDLARILSSHQDFGTFRRDPLTDNRLEHLRTRTHGHVAAAPAAPRTRARLRTGVFSR